MSEKEHPVQQRIEMIELAGERYIAVGLDGLTRIEACTKSGMYADIPYVRVWAGDVCRSEFCQHNIVGVQFAEPEAADAQA